MRQEIKKKIFELSDKKYKKFHGALCPGIENIIGVRIPVLRKYAQELYNDETWKETFEQIDNEYYEEIMLKGMLIGFAKKENIDTILQYVEEYVPSVDNWAICDTFCAGLKITKKYKKEMWNLINKLVESNKEFEIRFAIVMILDYYIDEEYLESDYEIFDKIHHEGYYVKMAIAWAISICLIKYYDKTVQYLKKSKIDDWTYNKAIQKAIESYRISDERKNELRKRKK